MIRGGDVPFTKTSPGGGAGGGGKCRLGFLVAGDSIEVLLGEAIMLCTGQSGGFVMSRR